MRAADRTAFARRADLLAPAPVAAHFAGERKIARLPPRSAIVAFSAEEVYAIAELIRGKRGGAAVVLGALSPRTRNAQVELYQTGEVDYIVATDAIGMGLNLDVDHIAFASDPQIRRLAISPPRRRRIRPDRRPRRPRICATAHSARPGAARRSRPIWSRRSRNIASTR